MRWKKKPSEYRDVIERQIASGTLSFLTAVWQRETSVGGRVEHFVGAPGVQQVQEVAPRRVHAHEAASEFDAPAPRYLS